jgi:hypothetical protein
LPPGACQGSRAVARRPDRDPERNARPCKQGHGRHRVDYKPNNQARWVDESFEIKIRNHKTMAVEGRVVEHLYRWTNWDISKSSAPFKEVDAQTAAFTVEIPPDGEKVSTYQVHCSW